jgi:hypothetical protein
LILPLDSFEFFFTDSHQLEKLNTAQPSRQYRQLRVLNISTMKSGSGSRFNGVPRSGSRSRKAKNDPKKKLINFIFASGGCSLLRAEGFSCSLNVLNSTVA